LIRDFVRFSFPFRKTGNTSHRSSFFSCAAIAPMPVAVNQLESILPPQTLKVERLAVLANMRENGLNY